MTSAIRLDLSMGPYANHAAHLRDELARADVLVRAQVVRWRVTIGAAKPEKLWGMVHVSEAEIEQYLATAITGPEELPEPLAAMLEPFWQAEREAAAVIRAAVDATPPDVELRIERLRTRFELSAAQVDVILLCLLPELDLRYRRIFGYLQDNAAQSHPPLDLVGQLLHAKVPKLAEKRALFEPSSALVRWRLVQFGADAESRGGRAAILDERIASYLLGHDNVDASLASIVSKIDAGVEWEDLYADESTIAALRDFASHASERPSMLVLRGSEGSGRAKAAGAIASQRGLGLLRFDVAIALRDPSQWERLVTLAFREALLQNAALYVDGVDRLNADDRPSWLFDALVAAAMRSGVLTFFATEIAGDNLRVPHGSSLQIDLSPPRFDLRVPIWKAVLPESWADRDAAALTLAAAFQLNEGQIRAAAGIADALARRRSPSHPAITSQDLQEGARRQSGRRLVGFARRIEPNRGLTLDDVILNEANKRQLTELLDRVRLRSRLETEMHVSPTISHSQGLLVLFTGPSGTGKTLAAEVLANQQGVDLYKVDASAVVSKWVGETEKNLSRVFADAEGSDALLFFDECDSLFGQRGAINDARDRWANLQTNYLLQRVEDFSGIVIMASNLRKNIDDAFLRRIQVIVEFPAPDAKLRETIWARTFPEESTALTAADHRELAHRFSITGGSIRNVAVEASFRALAKGHAKIELREVIAALAREYQKLGRPITKGDFGPRFHNWVLVDVMALPAPV